MKLIIGLVLFVVALFAALTALLTTGTTSGERRWDIADLFARIVGAVKPSTIMLAITAIIPAMLLSTSAISGNEHSDTTHHGSKRKRFLGLVIIGTIALGLLTLLRSTFGGGSEQHLGHVDTETASGGHDDHASADVTAATPAPNAATQPA